MKRKLLQLNPHHVDDPSPPPPPPSSPTQLITMDSSMVLVILVLSTAILSLFFFCFYLFRPRLHDTTRPSSSSSTASFPAPTAAATTTFPKGLDPTLVRSLPLSSYGEAAASNRIVVDCAICLGEFGENDVVKVMPFCGHLFHPLCIDTWLSSHVSCPVCRSTRVLVLDELGEEIS